MSQNESSGNKFQLISTSKIKTDINNDLHAREWIDPNAVDAIAASIEQGQLYQPIILVDLKNDTYKVVDGEHRLEAHKQLEKDTIMALIIPEDEAIIWGLKANMTRSDYTPMEKSNALQKLFDRRKATAGGAEEYNQNSLAAEMKQSKGTISDYLCLQDLPEEIKRKAARDRSCSVIALRSIARSGYSPEKKITAYNVKVKNAEVAAEKRAAADKKTEDNKLLPPDQKKAILKEAQETKQPRAYKKLTAQKSVLNNMLAIISDIELQIKKDKENDNFKDAAIKETLGELSSVIKELSKKVSVVEKLASIDD